MALTFPGVGDRRFFTGCNLRIWVSVAPRLTLTALFGTSGRNARRLAKLPVAIKIQIFPPFTLDCAQLIELTTLRVTTHRRATIRDVYSTLDRALLIKPATSRRRYNGAHPSVAGHVITASRETDRLSATQAKHPSGVHSSVFGARAEA